MKRSKIFTSLIIVPTTLTSLFPVVTSCSLDSTVDSIPLSIDGSDWRGLISGRFTQEDYEIDQYTKTITYKRGVNIVAQNLVIPNEVWYANNSYTVVLGEQLFMFNQNIRETIELNNATKTIPSNCFNGCRNITQVIMRNPPTDIGTNAFSNCSKLQSVLVKRGDQLSTSWTEKIVSIGESAFESTKLEGDLFFADTLTKIEAKAFYNCDNIKIVNFNYASNLKQIGDEAFVDCFELSELFLPVSIEKIGANAFLGCENLKNIFLPNDSMTLTLLDSCFEGCKRLKGFTKKVKLFNCGKKCFYGTPALDQTLWNKMNVVPSEAFSKTNLSNITIEPELYGGPSDIQSHAFAFWSSLHVVDVSRFTELPKWTGEHIFTGCGSWGTLYVNELVWTTATEEQKEIWYERFSEWGLKFNDQEYEWHIEVKK